MLVFDKWDIEEITVEDPGLRVYINLKSVPVFHSHGKVAPKMIQKKDVPVIERLINSIMRSGTKKKVGGKIISDRKGTGKKETAYSTVEEAFDIIERKTKENPVQIFIRALENAAPREETTRVKMGGITKHVAVDTSPQRRVDFALRNIAIAGVGKAYKNRKNRAEALADEIIAASKDESSSMAIARKTEVERIAKGAR